MYLHLFRIVFFLLALNAGYVQAETLKRAILEDCSKAKVEWQAFDETQKAAYLPYLQRVLQLASKPPDIGLPSPLFPSRVNPLDEPQGSEISQALEPGRDLEAKRCALGFLRELGAKSIQSVPEILRLASERTLPQDFQEYIDQSVYYISHQAALQTSLNLSASFFDELLSSPSEFLARNVLIELYTKSIPFLLASLSKAKESEAARLLKLLTEIDPSGQVIAGGLLDIISAENEWLSLEVLRLLPKLNPEVSPLRTKLFKLLEAESQKLQLAACLNLAGMESLTLERQEFEDLLSSFSSPSDELADCAGKLVLNKLVSSLQSSQALNSISALLEHEDKRLGLRALGMLGLFIDKAQSEAQRQSAYLMLNKALYAEPVSLNIAAIRSLVKAKTMQGQVMTAFSRFLKSVSLSKSKNEKLEAVFALAGALAENNLTSASGNTLQQLTSMLIDLLGHPDAGVQDKSFQALSAIGADIIKPLKKSFTTASGIRKHRLAKILLTLGDRDPSVLSTISSARIPIPCEDLELLFKLRLEMAAEVLKQALNCLSGNTPLLEEVIGFLSSPNNDSDALKAKLLSLLVDPHTSSADRLKIALQANAIGLKLEDVIGPIFAALENRNFPQREVLIKALKTYGPAVGKYEDRLKHIFDKEEEAGIRIRLAILLSDTTANFDMDSFLDDSLEKGIGHPEFEALKRQMNNLAAAKLMPHLIGFLSDESLKTKHAAIQSMGLLGKQALAAKDLLIPLLSSQDPEERYLSTQALIRIDPSVRGLADLLKQILVSRHWRLFHPSDFTGEAGLLLEAVKAMPLSHLEQVRLASLDAAS